jgi:hypothetical protein
MGAIMSESAELDLPAVHRHFSAECFNRAWDLIDQPDRSAEEDEQMLLLSLASLWHWTQRQDCQPVNKSIGYWQVSRVYALLGQADNARRFGQLCLQASQVVGIPPFYLGFAYEALARAEAVAGNRQQMANYLEKAQRAAEQVADAEEKNMLLSDLQTIH